MLFANNQPRWKQCKKVIVSRPSVMIEYNMNDVFQTANVIIELFSTLYELFMISYVR